MTLLSSLQLAKQSLFASQIGIQVAGNNIANSDTPGYIRETAILQTGPTQRLGHLLLGSGVQVAAIVQQIDHFLEQRLRNASSDLAGGEVQEKTYLQLESLLGELSDTDLSTSLSNFFNSVNEVLNQPENSATRNLVVLQGQRLAQDIRRLDTSVQEVREDLNQRVVDLSTDINRLVTEIDELNRQIVLVEQGRALASDAVGLRDQRHTKLADLAKIIDIRVEEQSNGSVNVFTANDYLIFEQETRQVKLSYRLDRGLSVADVKFVQTDAPILASSGELVGLVRSRDEILTNFTDDLNEFTKALVFEVNKVHSGGQGLVGYQKILSEYGVDDATVPLDEAGLPFDVTNGTFQVLLKSDETGLTTTTDFFVRFHGLDDDTTLQSLTDQLNAIDGVKASITKDGKLSIETESPTLQLSFADDTSGVLAALGVNTFFTGTDARTVDVKKELVTNPGLLAASSGGIAQDSFNAERLAGLLNAPLDSQEGLSLAVLYEQLAGQVTQSADIAKSITGGFRVFHSTLEGEKLGVSGVSIDEEAINMITSQRIFQASARLISTISELLDVLVSL